MSAPDAALVRDSAPRLPTVSVVIPSLNGRERLPTVLAPLLADEATTEVLVVVDGSRDGSLELLAEFAARDPRVRAIGTDRIGANAARQRGAESASAAVVLLLDDDGVAEPGLVTGHARRHTEQESIVVLGYSPVTLPPVRRPGDFARYLYARDYDQAFAELALDPKLVLHRLWGMNVSLRRSDCLRVGLWSEAAPSRYHEDRDFGLRCLRAGLVGVFDPTLRARHLYVRPTAEFIADARAQGAGRALLHRIHLDLLGHLPDDAFVQGLPGILAALVKSCRIGLVHAAVAAPLRAALALAGSSHAFALETRVAQLLRRVEQQYGAAARAAQ